MYALYNRSIACCLTGSAIMMDSVGECNTLRQVFKIISLLTLMNVATVRRLVHFLRFHLRSNFTPGHTVFPFLFQIMRKMEARLRKQRSEKVNGTMLQWGFFVVGVVTFSLGIVFTDLIPQQVLELCLLAAVYVDIGRYYISFVLSKDSAFKSTEGSNRESNRDAKEVRPLPSPEINRTESCIRLANGNEELKRKALRAKKRLGQNMRGTLVCASLLTVIAVLLSSLWNKRKFEIHI